MLLRRHRYKLMLLGGTAVIAPFIPIGLRSVYSAYYLSYRFYYIYAIMSAIQSSTCNWVSTPQVMCFNVLINYVFDPDTAGDIIKGVFWLSCKIVKGVQYCSNQLLDSVGGV
jgi:hypothetical protein